MMLDHRKRHTGSALIEAMVAVLVFSFGILALVSMQAAAIRNGSDAKYRADASFLANQIIGRMWVDLPANLINYATGPAAAAGDCSAGAAAAGVPSTWLAEVARLLPGADTTRQQITVAGNAVTVRVCWLDRSSAGAGYHNHVVTAQIFK